MDTSVPSSSDFPDRCPVCRVYVIVKSTETCAPESCSRCGHLALSLESDGFKTLVMRLESTEANADVLGANRLRTEALSRLSDHIARRDGPPHLALDLAGVKLISSSVVGQLIALHKTVQSRAGRLRLRNVGSETRDVFRVMGLARYFEIVDS